MKYIMMIQKILLITIAAIGITSAGPLNAYAAGKVNTTISEQSVAKKSNKVVGKQKFTSKSSRSLSKGFKSVSQSRLKRIATGRQGLSKVNRAVGPSNLVGCDGGLCICTGDSDCNDLFSKECSSHSSGGACAGSGASTICYCTP